MKIVIALPWSPWPVQRGTGRLIMNLISGLAVNHEIFLVTMTRSHEESERLKEIETKSIHVRSMVAPNKRSPVYRAYYKARNIIAQTFSGIPLETSYSAPKEFIDLIKKVAREEEAGLILANYWHLYRLPSMLEGIPTALITHDIDYLIERQSSQGGARTKRGKRGRPELEEAIEKSAYRNFKQILTVTRQDAEMLLKEMPEKRGCIRDLPLSMDLEKFSPSGQKRDKETVIFTGTFDSDFNIDALSYLLDDIVPLLVSKRPSIRIRIVGGGVSEDLVRSSDDHVEYLGYVEDLTNELDRAAALILPLRFAGGVRIRMLEAAAMRIPVVSTSVGIAGMGLENGREYLLADSPAEMVETICKVLDDEELADSIATGAREWVERYASQDDYSERLDRMIRDLLNRDGDQSPG